MDFFFFFSWLGPILVVISLAVPNVMWFRVLNLTGSSIAAITSAIDSNWPMVFMNGTIALINIYWIIRLTRKSNVVKEAVAADATVNGTSA